MPPNSNELGQPIGEALPGWQPAAYPKTPRMAGRFCDLELIDAAKHAGQLFEAFAEDTEGRMWTYMANGPFATGTEVHAWLEAAETLENQVYYAVVDRVTGRAVGIVTYLRIQPGHGVVEVGAISYAPALQRTPAATEAMYLMMRQVFEVWGYRRYEWKCDDLNAASKRAAERFGFSYDGLFRQAVIYKGRNRDTAWYSILDKDWPRIKEALEAWLALENFDADGGQKRRLEEIRAGIGGS